METIIFTLSILIFCIAVTLFTKEKWLHFVVWVGGSFTLMMFSLWMIRMKFIMLPEIIKPMKSFING